MVFIIFMSFRKGNSFGIDRSIIGMVCMGLVFSLKEICMVLNNDRVYGKIW